MVAAFLPIELSPPSDQIVIVNMCSDMIGRIMLVTQAYRYALDPSPRQTGTMWSHCGAHRFAYNWGLDLVKQRLDQRASRPGRRGALDAADAAAGVEPRQAPGRTLVAGELQGGLQLRAGRPGTGAEELVGLQGRPTRKGRRVGFPRFKGKRRSRLACRFTTGAIRVEPDRHHVVLPRMGRIRTHESTRKLARRLDAGTARILSATISQAGGRWYVSFTVEVHRAVPDGPSAVQRRGGTVGVDVGVRHLAVLSTGEAITNPRPLGHAQRRLRRLNRQLARRRGPRAPDGTRRVPSRGWQQTRRRLARAHARVANARRDGLHKLTSQLATSYDTVVVEQLHVAGMMRNRRLARPVADAGFAELRRQLAYKTTWYGSVLVTVDRWYPSSKTCSGCGVVKAKLPLSVRVFACEACGLVASTVTTMRRGTSPPSSTIWSPGVARRPETPVEGT